MFLRPARFARDVYSGVAKQRLEAEVHVQLDVAVKQREARLVGD